MTRAHEINRVRQRREQLGMLVGELADSLPNGGRSAAFISVVEHGFVPKHFRRLEIATALETTPESLWPEEYA